MVNSGSYDGGTGGEGDPVKSDFTQLDGNVTSTAASPRHIVVTRDDDFTAATAEMIIAPEPEEDDSKKETASTTIIDTDDSKTSLHCSVPLHKVKDVLNDNQFSTYILESLLKKTTTNEGSVEKSAVGNGVVSVKRLLCLFCDRTFQSASLKQKHVDRCHSSGLSRRSSRQIGNNPIACSYCSKLNHTEHSWEQLFEHLVNEHSNRYFGCVKCQERFGMASQMKEHKKSIHGEEDAVNESVKTDTSPEKRLRKRNVVDESVGNDDSNSEVVKRITRSVKNATGPVATPSTIPNKNRKKLISVKSTKHGVRTKLRTRRAAAIALKQINSDFVKIRNKKRNTKQTKTIKKPPVSEAVAIPDPEPTPDVTKSSSVFSLVNLFTFKYEKIYDHASDSIRDVNTGKFDDVFDRDFYQRTVNNIKENLLLHLDGKLNRNIQSENRISNFVQPETEAASSNCNSDISLNAMTPVATLLSSSQYGEDFDAQIEYASRPTQKKSKKDKNVVYKFTNRKYNSLYRERGVGDLTGLDMWTQLKVKEKQHHGNETIPETCRQQVDELNNILDKRGPFEDLKLEQESLSKITTFDVVTTILDNIIDNVFDEIDTRTEPIDIKPDITEFTDLNLPNYLNLQHTSSMTSNDMKNMKNDSVELTGEWARARLYICATCAQKLPNMKALEEHKNISHPNIWSTHYEFVGKQSEFYTHLGIPGLGKVGVVEMMPMTKYWQRSDARLCTKCAKQCNTLGELHRHMLECGGDWTWMLARKKVKYRPYGSRRRRQRGYKRTINPDIPRAPREPREPKVPKPIGPRPKPSDAETIEKMLANLPAKRIRKVISMRDGIQRPRKYNLPQNKTLPPANVKETNSKTQKIVTNIKPKLFVRTLRSRVPKSEPVAIHEVKIQNKRAMNRVLGSKILDTSTTMRTRRRFAKTMSQNDFIRRTRQRTKMETETVNETVLDMLPKTPPKTPPKSLPKIDLEEENKVIVDEIIIEKKKSTGKRLLSLISKPKKKLKLDKQDDTNKRKRNETIKTKSEEKPEIKKDTISEVIESVVTETERNRDTISEVIEAVIKSSIKKQPVTKKLQKKASKFVENVKMNLKKKAKLRNIKDKGIATKLIRTLSLRASKRHKKVEEDKKPVENKKQKTDTTIETGSKNGVDVPENGGLLNENVSVADSKLDSSMPELEKIDAVPVENPLVDSIPVLTRIVDERKSHEDEKPLEESTSVVNHVTSKDSKPINNLKNKFKRTGKGLNDCIAMLKCKLEMKTDTIILNTVENHVPLVVEKNEYIEKNLGTKSIEQHSEITEKSDKKLENSRKIDVKRQKVDIVIKRIETTENILDGIIDLSISNLENKISEPKRSEKTKNLNEINMKTDNLIQKTEILAKRSEELTQKYDENILMKNKTELKLPKTEKTEHTTVLKIPSFTRNLKLETPILSEMQTVLPDLHINEITSVFDVAMKNCLLECVKSKCQELKNTIEIETKPETERKTFECDIKIPQKPANLIKKRKIGSVRRRKNRNEVVKSEKRADKTETVSDDEDVPLSAFIKPKFQRRSMLKLKLPKRNQKTNQKPKISTPIRRKMRELTLEDKIEEHVELDNSLNNKIEEIQSKIEGKTEKISDKNWNQTEENVVSTCNILSPVLEPEVNEIKDFVDAKTNPENDVNPFETPKRKVTNEIIENISLPLEPTPIESIKCSTPVTNETASKVILTSLPLQIMNIEDEPSEILLTDETLNTEPIIESAKFPEPEVNHMDSGKENSDDKLKLIVKKQKRISKKGRKKLLENGEENSEIVKVNRRRRPKKLIINQMENETIPVLDSIIQNENIIDSSIDKSVENETITDKSLEDVNVSDKFEENENTIDKTVETLVEKTYVVEKGKTRQKKMISNETNVAANSTSVKKRKERQKKPIVSDNINDVSINEILSEIETSVHENTLEMPLIENLSKRKSRQKKSENESLVNDVLLDMDTIVNEVPMEIESLGNETTTESRIIETNFAGNIEENKNINDSLSEIINTLIPSEMENTENHLPVEIQMNGNIVEVGRNRKNRNKKKSVKPNGPSVEEVLSEINALSKEIQLGIDSLTNKTQLEKSSENMIDESINLESSRKRRNRSKKQSLSEKINEPSVEEVLLEIDALVKEIPNEIEATTENPPEHEIKTNGNQTELVKKRKPKQKKQTITEINQNPINNDIIFDVITISDDSKTQENMDSNPNIFTSDSETDKSDIFTFSRTTRTRGRTKLLSDSSDVSKSECDISLKITETNVETDVESKINEDFLSYTKVLGKKTKLTIPETFLNAESSLEVNQNEFSMPKTRIRKQKKKSNATKVTETSKEDIFHMVEMENDNFQVSERSKDEKLLSNICADNSFKSNENEFTTPKTRLTRDQINIELSEIDENTIHSINDSLTATQNESILKSESKFDETTIISIDDSSKSNEISNFEDVSSIIIPELKADDLNIERDLLDVLKNDDRNEFLIPNEMTKESRKLRKSKKTEELSESESSHSHIILDSSLPDSVPNLFNGIKTPTMDSDDSDDEIPLSFIAKNLTQNIDVLDDLVTPSINDIGDDESNLEKAAKLLEDDKNLIDDLDKIEETDKINESERIDETVLDISYDLNETKPEESFITTPDMCNKSLVIKIQKNFNVKVKSRNKKAKKRGVKRIKPIPETDDVEIFCDICNKTFTRNENLVKHKRTLTHISKLSEIEARENAARQKLRDLENTSQEIKPDESIDENINMIEIDDISIDKNYKNSNLKLVDIINDVLDKPVEDLNMSESVLLPQKLNLPETKRYKSLGERKSFDSDYIPHESPIQTEFTKSSTNQLLTTQLSLLENIIEKNSSELNYIDDSISSSTNETSKNTTTYPEPEIKFSHSNDIISSFIKPDYSQKPFIKPINNFDEQTQQFQDSNVKETTRKILNRDEELFLECCSLLKSGSESMSKKQTNNYIPRESYSWLGQNNRVETPIGEYNDWSNSNSGISSEWTKTLSDQQNETTSKSFKSTLHFDDISLDSSATRNTEISPAVSKRIAENVPLDFHHVNFQKNDLKEFNESEKMDERESSVVYEEIIEEKVDKEKEIDDVVDENLKRHVVSAFGGLMAKALKSRLTAVVRRSVKAKEKRTLISALQPAITKYAVPITRKSDDSNDAPKKIVTKGAMKVFEGIKVSIPTQDLNLQEVLKAKTIDKPPIISQMEAPKIGKKIIKKKNINRKKQLFKRFGNKLGLKETKKKNNKKSVVDEKLDVYDFDDSGDNNSLLQTNLTEFRNNRKNDPVPGEKNDVDDSESETDRYYDSISYEENSLSSESNIEPEPKSESLLKKDNQKKCMIMGRIFKNASKPKLEDKIPEIRDISSEENSKLVENYLESYSSFDNLETTVEPLNHGLTIINSANKMSKVEMDHLFDKLLEENKDASGQKLDLLEENVVKQVLETKVQNSEAKQAKKVVKPKPKVVKKRQRHNSEDSTSTDEFILHGKARSSKKHKRRQRKPKENDGGINLEQEMKECIGVAGRKSQRKCTSGKQNVLAEFWSSDESEIDFILDETKTDDIPLDKTKDLYDFELEFDEINEIVPKLEHTEKRVSNERNGIVSDSQKTKKTNKNRRHSKSKERNEFEMEFDELNEEGEDVEKDVNDINYETNHNISESLKYKLKKNPKNRRHSKSKDDSEFEERHKRKHSSHSESSNVETLASNRRKRNAAETLYYWSSTSDDDEFQDMIEVKPIREDTEEDRPMQHGWIVGDSPKKLVTMLAQAKGLKKIDCESVKEQKKSRTTL